MFKDENCTCDSYCTCIYPIPCTCEGMGKDPHCEICCEHLTPKQEALWIKSKTDVLGSQCGEKINGH